MNNNFSDMDRVNRIWRHPVYQEHYKKIQELESERIFCRHTPEHFLDVARLMYIYALEEHLELPKELIYAAALLHDIGRAQQYQYNIPRYCRSRNRTGNSDRSALYRTGKRTDSVFHWTSPKRRFLQYAGSTSL